MLVNDFQCLLRRRSCGLLYRYRYRSDPISPACVTVTRRAACTVTRRVRVQSRSRDWADEMMMMQNRDDL